MPKKQPLIQLKDGHRILIALAMNLVVLLVCLLFLVPEAMNNDDLIIHSITSGAFGEFSPELGHTNILYGRILAGLQKAASAWNWFEILNVGMLFFSTFFISCVIWLQNPNLPGFLLSAAFFLFVGPIFYNQLHNSKEMPYIAAAALFTVFFGTRERKIGWCIAGGILGLLASWVRFHAFILGAAFAFGPCAIWLIVTLWDGEIPDRFKRVGAMALTFVLIFAVIFGTYWFDVKTAKTNKDLGFYRDYNAARGAVSDYELPSYAEYYTQYAALGLSENDVAMMSIWDFADLEVFPTETLNEVASLRPAVSTGEAVKRMVSEFVKGIFTSPLQFAFTVLFLAALVLTRHTEKSNVLWMALASVLCYLFMCLTGRTTHWVTAGLFGAALTGVFVSIRWKKGDLSRIFAALLLLLALLFDVVTLLPEVADYSMSFNAGAGRIYGDLGEREEDLYLMDHNSAPPMQRVVPTFSSVKPDTFRNVYVLGGWDTGSSAKNSVLERYQVFGSPYRALIEKRNVYLADTQNAAVILKYVREHYAPNATMALQETVDGYSIYAFTNQRISTEDTSLVLNDAAASIDLQFGNYVYAGAVFAGKLEEGDTVYIQLIDPSGSSKIYRAHAMEREDGKSAAVLWAPIVDIPDPGSVTFRVFVENGSGTVRGSEIFDPNATATEE